MNCDWKTEKERKGKKGKRKTNKHSPKTQGFIFVLCLGIKPFAIFYKRAFLWTRSKSKARGIALRVLTFKRHLTFFILLQRFLDSSIIPPPCIADWSSLTNCECASLCWYIMPLSSFLLRIQIRIRNVASF